MRIKIFLLSMLIIIGCSGGGDSTGDTGLGNGNGNNNGDNTGNNNGNDLDKDTDPDNFNDSSSGGNTTYYISFSDGDDSNDGKSDSKPFKNLGKINSITFAPGDKIKFKNGDSWKGYFKIRGKT